jgi:hypothetical protein
MKQSVLSVAILVVLVLGPVVAHGQAPTPTPTPTPSLCSIATLPDGTPPNCNTGAEEPPSFLGVSGGNYNSVAVTISRKTGTTVNCCTGTFGALVEDSTGTSYVLSSNHAMARNSSTTKAARQNEPIVQPGLLDLGCWQDPTDTVAKLSKWTPINFSRGSENQLDAAIAEIVAADQGPSGPAVPGVDPEGRIFNVGQISSTPLPFDDLIDGLPVMKMSRTSCLTSGAIDAFDAMGVVVYPSTCNVAASGTALFDHQILVIGIVPGSTSGTACTFAQLGDSGALVLTLNFECPQAIGIMFAEGAGGTSFGPDTGGVIVAVNPIQTVLNKFKVSLVGKECTPSAIAEQTEASSPLPEISSKLRASIEYVRTVKEAHARNLLNNPEVVAVGIGAGDSPDTSMLNVYLQKDTPEIRRKVLSEINGAARVRFKHAGKFRAL